MIRTCGVCGKEYTRTHQAQRYCEAECRRVAKNQNGKRYRQSEGGKAYFKAYRCKPEYLEKVKAYCKSRRKTEEQKAAKRAYMLEYRNKMRELKRQEKKARVEIQCRNCGTTFARPHHSALYCSTECRIETRTKQRAEHAAKIAAIRASDPVLDEAHRRQRSRKNREYEERKRAQQLLESTTV